jgi:hypothetical protein
MRVFVTGATGLVGRALVEALVARGDRPVALTRGGHGAVAGAEMVVGDCTRPGDWQERVVGCDAVVHLAGEPIGGGRLDPAHLERVRASRVDSTRLVVEAIASASKALSPRVLLCASGVDYYPFDESDRAWNESGGAADTALGQVCAAWEREAATAEPHGVRVARMRAGLVLAGAALDKMALPFKMFAGGPIGSGRQWFSWVSLEDTVGAYLFALRKDEARGPINVVGPGAVRQKELARAIGRALGRPSWVPVPAFAVRAATGGLAEYILHGRRVVPQALAQLGYAFRHADVSAALAEAL